MDSTPVARGRARSWSPPSLANASVEDASSGLEAAESEVLFDACRFPRPTGDLLDWVIGEEPWQTAETLEGCKVRVVGEAGALKRLFELPLQAAGEAVCLHRIGDCLVVLDAGCQSLDEDDEDSHTSLGRGGSSASSYSPRTAAVPRCQVRVDGDMVRVFPSIETAEPVNVDGPPAATAPAVACCEWRVREGLSLLAVTPHSMSSGDCGLADLSRSSQLRLLDVPSWPSAVKGLLDFESVAGSLVVPNDVAKSRPSLPACHRRVTEERTAILVVPLAASLETRTLVDSWLSCCLQGSPSLLCFFVDSEGVCRGCQFVMAADIPYLEEIAEAYRAGGHRRLTAGNAAGTSAASSAPGSAAKASGSEVAFEPRALREVSHALLEAVIDHCDRDGGHFLLVPGPFGPRLLRAGSQDSEEDTGSDEEGAMRSRRPLALKLSPDPVELLAGAAAAAAAAGEAKAPRDGKASVDCPAAVASSPDRLRTVYVTQALLMYHAAVRLAQPPRASSPERGKAQAEVKDVPTGSRWTAKSCRHPLRVRKMMLRAVRALRMASQTASAQDGSPSAGKALSHRRYHLLLSSSFEFLADTFLAEDARGDSDLDISRNLTALRHLHKSSKHLAEYAGCLSSGNADGNFARSVRQLEERVNAKAINAHLCLARLRQRQPWSSGDGSFRAIGQALKELDAAEELVAKPSRLTQPQRAAGPYECSLLASISKWKADLLHDLAALALPCVVPGAELEPGLRDYLEAQQKEMNELLQPLPTQCERWFQSTVSLSLRALHQLAAVPSEVASELQQQARALLARAYGKLGHLYASTGRFTKAMTHAKQGIELFNATKDKLQAAKLQLWLCRLQLRMAVPQAAPSGQSACVGLLEDPALLSGLSAASAAEDTALAQVVQHLQKCLNALDGSDTEELSVFSDGQVLLGRVMLRQGLMRLARAPAPYCTSCRLCEEDGALFSALELLQAPSDVSSSSSESGGAAEASKEAVERLLQAAACFRTGNAPALSGLAHACLAFVYYCSRSDPRVQRLSLTHCQHALEQLPTADSTQHRAIAVAVKLLEAKGIRRSVPKGSPAWAGDARAAAVLCEVALSSCPESPAESCVGGGGSVQLMSYLRQELSDALLRLLKSYDRQDNLGRELKPLYCSLVTAWHAEAGQADALAAISEHARKLLAAIA